MVGGFEDDLRRAESPRSEALARRPAAVRPELQGHAADGRRHAVRQHALVGRRRRTTRRTGALKWVYNPKSYEAGTTTMSLRWNQRGVAYWTRRQRRADLLGHRRRLSRSPSTPRPAGRCAGFGVNGRVDLMDGLPRAKRGTRDYLNALTYSVQSPPIVVNDLVITPASISSLDQDEGTDSRLDPRLRRAHRQGAMDVPHGAVERRVRQRHVERRLQRIRRQGHGVDDDERGRGARPRLPADQHDRAGLSTALIVSATTCSPKAWSRSTCRPASASGTSRPCITGCGTTTIPPRPTCSTSPSTARASRRWRRSPSRASSTPSIARPGKPVWPIDETPVPPSDVPGEKASPTQPFPTRPAPFEYQGVTVDDLADFTPEIRAMAMKAIKGFRIGPLFTPPSVRRHHLAAGHHRRRQLERRGRRSGDGHAVRAVAQRASPCIG